ncbi:Bicyclogermacrene synthase [Acorus calamus]|uniref:Bicyclogermacrene synthase n=1 Tax=Acorus calamus TaxID=4465 RepID=A0AAV9EL24_ACOCL|nr:Bicyclogermacrene synthase [Acorus calamus]
MFHLPLIKNNNKVSVSLAMDIERALHMPLRKGLARLQARQYISIYEKDEQRNDVLLELAKLDYNRVQRMLQKEVKNISLVHHTCNAFSWCFLMKIWKCL